MSGASLHHVSIVTRDLTRSIAFYESNLGFRSVDRPPFSVAGAWLKRDGADVHLIENPQGTFPRREVIDTADSHFALRVDDFDAAIDHLKALGYREDAASGDTKRLLVIRHGVAGFPQAYLLDPDWHVIEINARA